MTKIKLVLSSCPRYKSSCWIWSQQLKMHYDSLHVVLCNTNACLTIPGTGLGKANSGDKTSGSGLQECRDGSGVHVEDNKGLLFPTQRPWWRWGQPSFVQDRHLPSYLPIAFPDKAPSNSGTVFVTNISCSFTLYWINLISSHHFLYPKY